MDIDSLNMSKHHYNCAITVQLSLSFHSRTKLKKEKKVHCHSRATDDKNRNDY